jgi:hypothetical protein
MYVSTYDSIMDTGVFGVVLDINAKAIKSYFPNDFLLHSDIPNSGYE